MIASLSGQVLSKTPAAAIIDVHGVGYELYISSRTYDTLPEIGQSCFLYVQTVVREDAITLYGFGGIDEKELFLLLVTVTGIGPKLALTILSGIAVNDLCQAITLRDLDRLTAISGVGKKTAQRICVELSEKAGAFGQASPQLPSRKTTASSGEEQALADAVSALINLGYPQYTAWQALRAVQQQMADATQSMRVEDFIRMALQHLASQ